MERGEEQGHVGGDRLGVELHLEAVSLEDGSSGDAGRFQLMAQGGERHAETMASDRQVARGPEQFDEEFARMASVEMESQIGEQGGCLLGAKSGDGSLAQYQAQSTQEFDTARRVHALVLVTSDTGSFSIARLDSCLSSRPAGTFVC
jgi:hypothetical protein